MAILPYRPVRGYGATLNGDAQVEDQELQDADLTQPGVLLRGPGASELPARVHESGGTETVLDPDGGQALFWRPDVAGDELCLVHEDTLYTSKPTEVTADGTQAWRRVGTWAPWKLRNTALIYPQAAMRDWDVTSIVAVATGKRYYVAVWEQANAAGDIGQPAAPGVYAAAFDETGGIVAPATQLAAGANHVNPRACACDTGVVIMWHDTGISTWMGSAWQLSNPIEFVAATALVAGSAGTAPLFDLRKDGANDQVIAVLADSVGAFSLPLRLVTVSLVVTSLGAVAAVQAPSVGVAVDVDPIGGYLLSWADATTANVVHVNNAGVADTTIATFVTTNPPVRITGCHVDGVASQGTVVVEQRPGLVPDYDSYCETLSYDGLALTSVREQRGCVLTGHAQVFAGRPLFMCLHPGTAIAFQPTPPSTVFVVDAVTGDVMSRAFPLSATGATQFFPQQFTQPCTPNSADERALWGMKRTAAFGVGVSATSSASIFTVEIERDIGPRSPATFPGYVFDAMSGFPMVYDGFEGSEADWHTTPMISAVAPGAGGGLIAGTTYVIAVTYRWIDRRGQVWRSAPLAMAVTLAGAQNQITVTVVPARWTTRRTNVAIELWRSLSNEGFPLYLENTAGILPNDAAVDAVTLVANASDSATAQQEQLDQFGPSNILPHESVPMTDFMAVGLGRIWAPDPERPDILRHTIAREIDRDGFGWGWEPTQLVQIGTSVRSQAGGELQGSFASMAGDKCWLIFGLGPDKQGSGAFGQPSSFSVVDLETSQAMVAQVPDSAVPGGLAYATPRGLYLLRRDQVSQGLSPQIDRLFRFDGVEPQALAYEPERGQLWLMTLTAEARSHRFSLLTGRWCADSARRAQDVAVSVCGVVAWLMPGSSVRIQDATLIADGADDLAFSGETPTLRLDPSNVGQPVTVQALLLHVYVLVAPAVLEVAIVDAKTGEVKDLQQQTFTVLGPQSRSTAYVNLATTGHRIRWSQPAGDTGRIVVVEIDSQVEPADGVLARTVTPL